MILAISTPAHAVTGPPKGGVVNIPMGAALADPGQALGLAINPVANVEYVGVDTPKPGVNVVNSTDRVIDFIPVPDGAESLAYDQNSGYLFAAHDSGSSHAISMIDPVTKSVATYVVDDGYSTVPMAVTADAVHQKVYVESRGPDYELVTVFDETTRTHSPSVIIDRTGTGGGLVRPLRITVDPYQQKAYALIAYPLYRIGQVTVFDGVTNSISGSPIPVDPTSRDVAVDPITHQLFVANDSGVAVFDTNTDAAIGSPIATGGSGALSVGVDPTSHRVFAGTPEASVAVIDEGAPGTLTGIIAIVGPAGAQPQQTAVNPRTSRAFTANGHGFWLTGIQLGSPVITSGPPANGTAGLAYSFTFTADGLPAPEFSDPTSSLPSWLTLDPTTGRISGTPPTPGTFHISVTASNHVGPDAVASFDVVVDPPLHICLPWICY